MSLYYATSIEVLIVIILIRAYTFIFMYNYYLWEVVDFIYAVAELL